MTVKSFHKLIEYYNNEAIRLYTLSSRHDSTDRSQMASKTAISSMETLRVTSGIILTSPENLIVNLASNIDASRKKRRNFRALSRLFLWAYDKFAAKLCSREECCDINSFYGKLQMCRYLAMGALVNHQIFAKYWWSGQSENTPFTECHFVCYVSFGLRTLLSWQRYFLLVVHSHLNRRLRRFRWVWSNLIDCSEGSHVSI